jgi:hypothetical protein
MRIDAEIKAGERAREEAEHEESRFDRYAVAVISSSLQGNPNLSAEPLCEKATLIANLMIGRVEATESISPLELINRAPPRAK